MTLLERLLRQEDRLAMDVGQPSRATVYRGADAELLRLQEEVLALALEVLRTAPASDEEPDRE